MSAGQKPERVALTPGEFAALFGKEKTWGYRQIYHQKVKTITQHGRILIPAKEVERILGEAGLYDGSRPLKAKTAISPKTKAALTGWQAFLVIRRNGGETAARRGEADERDAVLKRLGRR